MRVLYIDVDTLRPDHLGCYGYHRPTSPNIDRVASESDSVRLESCYASDTPCLPSRSALISGRFGIHTGVINHGGVTADLGPDGPRRGFHSAIGTTSWARRMQMIGMRTATISSFAQRHSAFHWLAGFTETYDVGKRGMELADEVEPLAVDWLDRHGREDDWFLHLHLWDPHTPYRTPKEYGDPFADHPIPEWLTEDVRQEHWALPGPHSAQEVMGYTANDPAMSRFPRQPLQIRNMADVRAMFDGYDTGVRYADDHIGRILNHLADLGVLDDTAIMISGDHGETLGELGIYCDHQTADDLTARVPLILKWPGLPGRVDKGLHYQIDVSATILELLGTEVPENWDGVSFAPALRQARDEGREYLVLSQAAWTTQRSVRWGDYLCIRTYNDALHALPATLLFNVKDDPYEQTDLAEKHPELVDRSQRLLVDWHTEAMARSTTGVDPLFVSLHEGGGLHSRVNEADYYEWLRTTGREGWADRLVARPARYGI